MTHPTSTIATVNGVRTRLFACACGQSIGVNDTKRRSNPEEWAMGVIRKQGWRAWKARKILCPACVTKEDETKMNKRTAIKITTVSEPEPLKADAPRKATLTDNRRINDALHAHYDDVRGCYATGHSDESLATALKVPRAWVAQVREAFFGPELSEADRALQTEISKIRARLEKVMTDSMNTATEAENTLSDLTKIANNLARKG